MARSYAVNVVFCSSFELLILAQSVHLPQYEFGKDESQRTQRYEENHKANSCGMKGLKLKRWEFDEVRPGLANVSKPERQSLDDKAICSRAYEIRNADMQQVRTGTSTSAVPLINVRPRSYKLTSTSISFSSNVELVRRGLDEHHR